ncbi:MAG TPA: hypothetical protein VL481_02300 [Verrucomicrobiae bacterium]|nr:hypothetical protein [Verrucomicrobiae bacterium]
MKKVEHTAGEPWDDRAKAYRRSGDMVAAIARRHSGVDVDDLTKERWRELMGLMREVDTWADDTDASRQEVLEGLVDFGMFQERYPHLAPGQLTIEAHLSMLRRTDHILRVGELASRELSVRRFMAFRITEAAETVNMFEDTATPHVVEQPHFKEDFMPTLRALGEAATLWDSLIDARQDLRDGKQVIQPNAEFYTRISGAMLRRVKLGGAAMLHFEPNMHIGIKVGERVVNRVKNGVTGYSTLNRFLPGRWYDKENET